MMQLPNGLRKILVASAAFILSFLIFVTSATLILAGTLVPGTPVSIASVNAFIPFSASIDSTHVAVVYVDVTNSSHPTVHICSVSGTTPACGSPVSIASVSSDYISVASLDSTHVVVAYKDTTNGSHPTVAICSVSGTTPTCGTPVSIASVTSAYTRAAAVDVSHLAVAYKDATNGSHPTVAICSVSGTTPTCGTPVSIASVLSANNAASALDSTHVAVGYTDATNGDHATVAICSVSGTTPTCDIPVSAASVASSYYSIGLIDSSHVAIGSTDASLHPYVTICSVSGTTPTCGTPVLLASVSSNNSSVSAFDTSHVAVTYVDVSNSSNPTAVVCSVSGTTPTCDTPVSLASVTGSAPTAAGLDSSHIAFAYRDGSNSNHPTLMVGLYSLVTAPTLTTQAASSLTWHSATGNGNITATGGATVTDRGFRYGLTTAYGATSTESGSFSTGAYTENITGLTCGSTYHYEAFGTNSAGTAYGSDTTFTTGACDTTAPTVTLVGDSTVYITTGKSYTEQGATATDDVDGSLTSSIVTTGSVDANTSGTYTVTYSATDAQGNTGSASRTVKVIPGGGGIAIFSGSAASLFGPAPVALPFNGGAPPGGTTPSSNTPATTPTASGPNAVLIAALTAQLQSLLAEIRTLTQLSGAQTGTVLGASSYNFTRDLELNDTGDDVKALQEFLNSHSFTIADSGPGSPGNETTTFGPATYRALIKFQEAQGITPASGFFGPMTRAAVQ